LIDFREIFAMKLMSVALLMMLVSLSARADEGWLEWTSAPFDLCAAALVEAENGNGYIVESHIETTSGKLHADRAGYLFLWGRMLFRFQLHFDASFYSCETASPKK